MGAHAAGPLDLAGWALFDPVTGTQPGSIGLGFQDQNGPVYAMPTLPVARFDLMPVFHTASAERAGFVTLVDVARLPPGRYGLLALMRHGGAVRSCALSAASRVIPQAR